VQRATSTIGAVSALVRGLIGLFYLVLFDLIAARPGAELLEVMGWVGGLNRINTVVFFVAIYVSYVVATEWRRRLPLHLVLGVVVVLMVLMPVAGAGGRPDLASVLIRSGLWISLDLALLGAWHFGGQKQRKGTT